MTPSCTSTCIRLARGAGAGRGRRSDGRGRSISTWSRCRGTSRSGPCRRAPARGGVSPGHMRPFCRGSSAAGDHRPGNHDVAWWFAPFGVGQRSGCTRSIGGTSPESRAGGSCRGSTLVGLNTAPGVQWFTVTAGPARRVGRGCAAVGQLEQAASVFAEALCPTLASSSCTATDCAGRSPAGTDSSAARGNVGVRGDGCRSRLVRSRPSGGGARVQAIAQGNRRIDSGDLSSRSRGGRPSSFNVITVNPATIEVETRLWTPRRAIRARTGPVFRALRRLLRAGNLRSCATNVTVVQSERAPDGPQAVSEPGRTPGRRAGPPAAPGLRRRTPGRNRVTRGHGGQRRVGGVGGVGGLLRRTTRRSRRSSSRSTRSTTRPVSGGALGATSIEVSSADAEPAWLLSPRYYKNCPRSSRSAGDHLRRHGWDEVFRHCSTRWCINGRRRRGQPVDHGPQFRAKARAVGAVPRARRPVGGAAGSAGLRSRAV